MPIFLLREPAITKKRPVLILNAEPLEVLSVKVTSQQTRTADKYDMPIVHWQYAGLLKPSAARISKTMFLDKDKFDVKIGTLHIRYSKYERGVCGVGCYH